MVVPTGLTALALLVQIANVAADLLALRKKGQKNTKDVDNKLLALLVDLFNELRFCQEVLQSFREFESNFNLIIIKLESPSSPRDLDTAVGNLNKWFDISIRNEVASVIEGKRRQMKELKTQELGNSHLADGLTRAASKYNQMVDSIQLFVLNFPRDVQRMSRDKENRFSSFRIATAESFQDVRDFEAATAESLVRVGSLVTDLIRGV